MPFLPPFYTQSAKLKDGENPIRALELYGMLMQSPLCAASRWFADGIGPHVAKAMDQLAEDVVGAALQRGENLDQREEARKLVDEVRALGWGSSDG